MTFLGEPPADAQVLSGRVQSEPPLDPKREALESAGGRPIRAGGTRVRGAGQRLPAAVWREPGRPRDVGGGRRGAGP